MVTRARSLAASARRVVAALTAVIPLTWLLAGCAGQARLAGDLADNLANGASGGGAFERWVDDELAPYLTDQLGRQPRFKGEPVLLVSMDGADIRPEIDALTRSVRARLVDRLLQANGPALVWRPGTEPWRHPDGRPREPCKRPDQVRYYVGIDIAALGGGRHRVSVRALEAGATTWVSGFGRSWQGRLNRAQRQAHQTSQADAYLRGLRVLPFAADETDLLGAYLGRQLGCRLRRHGEAGLRLYVDAAGGPVAQRLLTLSAFHLADRQSVVLTEQAASAELVLGGEILPIDGDLHQVWLTLRHGPDGTYAEAFGADAYVRLPGAVAAAPPPGPAAEPTAAVLPGPGARAAPAPVQPSTADAGWRPAYLSPLRLQRAAATGRCGSAARAIDPGLPIAADDCFEVVFDLHRPAWLFALHHDVDGRLRWSSCRERSRFGARFPARSGMTVQRYDAVPFLGGARAGPASVYVVATDDAGTADALREHFLRLPDPCHGAPAPLPADERRAWVARLARLMEAAPGAVDWQALRINHAGA
jgi:hypothetical protein